MYVYPAQSHGKFLQKNRGGNGEVQMGNCEEAICIVKKCRATILKEVPSVLFEVRHMFELFDTDRIVSWLPCKFVSLSSK